MAEWQPIETAPVNESVLIFIPSPVAEHYGPAIYRGLLADAHGFRVWKVTGLHFGSDCGATYHPSHWMPLPAPPSTPSEAVCPVKFSNKTGGAYSEMRDVIESEHKSNFGRG